MGEKSFQSAKNIDNKSTFQKIMVITAAQK